MSHKHKLLVGLACLWITLASLAPDTLLAGPFKIRPEDILTVIWAGFLLFSVILRGIIRRTVIELPFSLVLFGFMFGLIGLFAIWVSFLSGINLPSSGTFGHSLQLEVLKESARFAKYAVVAFIFANVPFRAWKPVLATLAVCCIIIVAIQVAQYCGASALSKLVNKIYNIDHLANWSTYGARNAGSWRSGSVIVQPNIMGAYLIVPQLLFLMLFFDNVKRYRFLWLCLSCIVFAGIFMTQSQTAMYAMLFGLFVGSIHLPGKVRRKLYRNVLLGAIVAVTVGTLFAGSMSKFTPTQILCNLNSSLGTKVHLTAAAIEQLGPQILLGAGPSNGLFVDNELGYIISWYGIVGLGVYYMFYTSLYYLTIRKIRSIYVRAAFIGTIAAYIVGAVANSFLLCNRVFPVFIALLALACTETASSSRHSKLVGGGRLPIGEVGSTFGEIKKMSNIPE